MNYGLNFLAKEKSKKTLEPTDRGVIKPEFKLFIRSPTFHLIKVEFEGVGTSLLLADSDLQRIRKLYGCKKPKRT